MCKPIPQIKLDFIVQRRLWIVVQPTGTATASSSPGFPEEDGLTSFEAKEHQGSCQKEKNSFQNPIYEQIPEKGPFGVGARPWREHEYVQVEEGGHVEGFKVGAPAD